MYTICQPVLILLPVILILLMVSASDKSTDLVLPSRYLLSELDCMCIFVVYLPLWTEPYSVRAGILVSACCHMLCNMCCSHAMQYVLFTLHATCVVHIACNMCCSHSMQHVLFTLHATCVVHIPCNMCCSHCMQHVLFTFHATCVVHMPYNMRCHTY